MMSEWRISESKLVDQDGDLETCFVSLEIFPLRTPPPKYNSSFVTDN